MRPIADCSSARVRPRASPYSTRARVTGAPPCPASWTRTTCITTPRASAYMWLGEKDSSACFSKRTRTTTSFSRRFRLPWGLGRPDTSEKAGRPRIASSWRFPRALAVAPKCGFTRCRTKDKRPVRSSVLQTHKLAYALLSALGWAGTVSGQSETAIIQQTARVANAIRVDHAPKIDGTLDDPLWKLAEPINNFAGLDRHRCDSFFDTKLHADERSSVGDQLQALHSSKERARSVVRVAQVFWCEQDQPGRRVAWNL